jgi:hypothetical protein
LDRNHQREITLQQTKLATRSEDLRGPKKENLLWRTKTKASEKTTSKCVAQNKAEKEVVRATYMPQGGAWGARVEVEDFGWSEGGDGDGEMTCVLRKRTKFGRSDQVAVETQRKK